MQIVKEEMQMEDGYINELLMKDEIIAEKEKPLLEQQKRIAELETLIRK